MKINVVMICDDKYVMPTSVAVTSLIENKNENSEIDIYIMCDKLSYKNMYKLKNLSTNKVNVIIREVDSSIYDGLEKKYSNVTCSSLLKFSIATELGELDKALYLDGDILVLDDLEKFYNQSLNEKYAAVIKDGPKPKKIPGGKKHEFYKNDNYFNSGVMLLNLKKMRDDNVSKRLIDYRLNEYNYFMDQDAFNCIFR